MESVACTRRVRTGASGYFGDCEVWKAASCLLVRGVGFSKKTLFRVVPWCFDVGKGKDQEEVWIGLFVSRPDLKGEADGPLEVSFRDIEVECVDGVTKLS